MSNYQTINTDPAILAEKTAIATARLAEIEAKATNITQRSPAWDLARITTIGGSKIATFSGQGFNSLHEMLEDILLPKQLPLEEEAEKKIAMNWGTIFEDALCNYISQKYGCKISATETFFIGEGQYAGLSYSPDGLAVMAVPTLVGVVEEQTENGIEVINLMENEPQVVLLEFKCPYKRFLRSYVPDYYLPQVWDGMELLGIKKALFVEAVIRPCQLDQMSVSGAYAKIFDTRNYKTTIASGVIGVYGEKIVPEVIDMSYLPAQPFNIAIHKMATGRWQYETFVEGRQYTHVLGWKLLNVGEHWVDPNPGFLEPLMPGVHMVLKFIHEMRGQDPQTIKAAIDGFYIQY